MAGVNENTEYIEEVYQLETEDPVLGGPDGISNLQAKALASRTKWLRAIIAEICASQSIVLNNAQTGQLLTALDARYFKNQNLPAQATDAELLAAIQAHNNAGDPHPQYTTENEVLSLMSTLNTPGEVCFFARSTPPTGYLKANGAAVSRITYADLFSAIGTTFGAGDGATTFNLPDLRGEFLRGWDDGRGVDAGRAFGSYQAEDFKSHSHIQGHTGFGSYIDQIMQGGGSQGWTASVIPTANTGGIETRPRNIALLPCIKF